MAVSSSNNLSEAERFWYESRVTGFPRSASLNDLKIRYWTSLSLTGSFNDLEKKWLRKVITDGGQTPTITNNFSVLLSQALSAQGISPSKTTSENWFRLYKNYNP